MRGETKGIPKGTNKDAGLLSERFQASFHYKTPPVVGVISLEGG
jgi:hypothetical protein